MLDLDSYCARIGYDGPRTPTIETLRAVLGAHAAAIPFEAIDVLLGRGVDLSPQAVDAKLIGQRRGGYCFEQNALFKRALTALGFQVEGLLCRSRWMTPPEQLPRPRTHMALRVSLQGEAWLADVGYSSVGLPAPLRFEFDRPQPTPHEAFRLTAQGDETLLEADLGDSWAPVYELPAAPALDIDFLTPNWFTSTHPDSNFRQNLIVGRTTPTSRHTLLNNRLRVRTPGVGVREEHLDADQLEAVLADAFGLPVSPDWRPVLEQAVAAGARAALTIPPEQSDKP